MVLMPTGGGKSICYQMPALLSTGVVIVVSPLIALMKDQVTALASNGIPAAAVNSMQTEETNRDILEQLFSGRVRILYISPERLHRNRPLVERPQHSPVCHRRGPLHIAMGP